MITHNLVSWSFIDSSEQLGKAALNLKRWSCLSGMKTTTELFTRSQYRVAERVVMLGVEITEFGASLDLMQS